MSINLRLDEEMHADLKRMAEEEDRPVANLIRRILKMAIEQHRGDSSPHSSTPHTGQAGGQATMYTSESLSKPERRP